MCTDYLLRRQAGYEVLVRWALKGREVNPRSQEALDVHRKIVKILDRLELKMEVNMDRSEYWYNGFTVPTRMLGAIDRYVKEGVLPGGFWTAVLENDLRRAVELADDENMRNLPAFVAFLYNEAPAACWGSKDRVKEWAEAYRMIRERRA